MRPWMLAARFASPQRTICGSGSGNPRFTAVPGAQDALLTTTSVAAFGFLTSNPEPITVQGSRLSVPEVQAISPVGHAIALVGGDITIEAGTPEGGTLQSSSLFAPKGHISLASTASPGEFTFGVGQNLQHHLQPNTSVTSSGTINLARGSTVAVSGSGAVSIRSGQFVIEIENASLNTTESKIPADSVTSSKGNLTLDNTSRIRTTSSANTVGAHITANVNTLTLRGVSEFRTDNSGNGQGGNLTLQGLGGAGTLADSVVISGASSGLFSFNRSGGNGGEVSVSTQSLGMDTGGQISTTATGVAKGPGGAIEVNTQLLNLSSGAFIKSETQGTVATARGGNVTVTAIDSAVFSGTQPNQPSGIFSASANGPAPTGDITVNAGKLIVTNSAVIQSGSPFDITGGGDVTVQGAGGSGTMADSVGISNGASISNQALATDAGPVSIFAQALSMDNGSINASTRGLGDGGDIVLNVGSVDLRNGAIISSQSLAKGNAGSINITAADQLVMTDSKITTAATQADGGSITMKAGKLIHLTDSEITSSVGNPDIKTTIGGNIFIDPDLVVLQNSKILANAFAGTGGNIDIVAGLLLRDSASIIDASSKEGVSGTIDIQAPIVDLSGSLVPLSQNFLNVGALLASRCAARVAGGSTSSSFVVAGRDGVPAEPGGLLPSPVSPTGAVGVASAEPVTGTGTSAVETGTLLALNTWGQDLNSACVQ
jgi:large exoprotein involved in heme utilization and adhesion